MGPHPIWGYIYIIIPNHPHSTLYIQYPGITTQPRYSLWLIWCGQTGSSFWRLTKGHGTVLWPCLLGTKHTHPGREWHVSKPNTLQCRQHTTCNWNSHRQTKGIQNTNDHDNMVTKPYGKWTLGSYHVHKVIVLLIFFGLQTTLKECWVICKPAPIGWVDVGVTLLSSASKHTRDMEGQSFDSQRKHKSCFCLSMFFCFHVIYPLVI